QDRAETAVNSKLSETHEPGTLEPYNPGMVVSSGSRTRTTNCSRFTAHRSLLTGASVEIDNALLPCYTGKA
ncbi:MAG: hypothetical protein Q7R41_04280, partial [Phycisphaerales bacterium]|nr:hypothetical protein [Phycisphaerales bacterium]